MKILEKILTWAGFIIVLPDLITTIKTIGLTNSSESLSTWEALKVAVKGVQAK